MMREAKREWKFCVSAKTLPGESMFVVGNCGELGSWSNKGALPLNKHEEESDDEGNMVWSGICKIPCERQVLYRYFVGVVIEYDDDSQATDIVVRRWETNVMPRTVHKGALSNVKTVLEPHTFGMYDGVKMVDRGWLTSETAVQFKLFNNPIQLWKRKYEGRKVFVKLTPIQLRHRKISEIPSDLMDESLDTQDQPEQQERWPITEISVMNDEEWELKLQDQFGRVYSPEDCVIFQVSLHRPETVAYMVDYYTYSLRAGDGEPPYHVGFSYILPGMLTSSEGRAIVPITSSSHRPIGQLAVDYVVIQPINGFECDMSISYSRVWKKSWQGLDVGHRGLGTSFKPTLAECAEVRENTIASLKTAASAGADLVEFDVQLSKDLIPVLYHDFHVCIAMKRKKQLADHDMLEMPVKDLTLDQLQQLKATRTQEGGLSKVLHLPDVVCCCGVYHLEEGKDKNQRFFDEELEEHQPFPTLCQALESLDPHVGFNIEIKWTMQLKDGSYELNHPFDLNLYLDTVLKVVLEHSGTRKIVFSCFHPDICTMLRLKQNRFPVVFLTQGVTSKYPAYRDPRTQTIPMAVNYACSAGILGINAHTEDILRDKQQVQLVLDAGLVVFCWGDDNNDPATIKLLKKLGIHGVIYDKIDQYSSKEVKESIFLAEAREMQKQLLKRAEEVSTAAQPPQSPPTRETFEVDDVEAVRKTLASASTGSLLCTWPINKEANIVETEAKVPFCRSWKEPGAGTKVFWILLFTNSVYI